MDFAKCRNLLFQRMKQQISLWFKSEDNQLLPNREVYQLLHELKGSAATLQLGGLYQISSRLLTEVEKKNEKQWNQAELRNFLYDLISLTYNYENFNEMEMQTEHPREENIPLIQIVDDDVSMLILLKDALEARGWMVITNSNAVKAIGQYFHFNPDCVILDETLAKKNDFGILQDMQNNSTKVFVPIIIMSTKNDKQTRIKAFRMGADDYLLKPVDLEELTVRMERHLQRKRLYDHTVLLDELTNLYNRRFLKDAFNRSMNDLKRRGQRFSLAILDIDYFKKINDKYGHLTGDKVIQIFAAFLKESTRSNDIVFRYGGEEFIILFQNTGHLRAVEIVSRLLDDFAKQSFEANGETFSITFSAGVNTITTVETTMEDAINDADQVLYKAKESGRSRVEGIHPLPFGFRKHKLFISVIDDDTIIRMMLIRVLQEMKIEHYEIDVQTFEDGKSFFDSRRLDKRGEHFLILDLILPVMNGLEILQKVKQTEHGKNVPVMMLTGRTSEPEISRALELGADDYITKPFNIIELQTRIKQLIQRMNN